MAIQYKTEPGTGADCSGTSGDKNRVFTLPNTNLTQQAGFIVYASGLALALGTEYTVNHLSADTTVTFLNGMWDDMPILVQYPVDGVTQNYENRRLDVQAIINEHGKSVTLIRQTETDASMGDVTDVSEETWPIVSLIQDITRKDRQIHDMGLAIPGNSKAFFYHEYPNSITGKGTVTVEVGDIILDENSKRWRIEQIIGQRSMLANEIFRSAVIKKIDLDT